MTCVLTGPNVATQTVIAKLSLPHYKNTHTLPQYTPLHMSPGQTDSEGQLKTAWAAALVLPRHKNSHAHKHNPTKYTSPHEPWAGSEPVRPVPHSSLATHTQNKLQFSNKKKLPIIA